MAIIRTRDIRKLSDKDVSKQFQEISLELAKERANIHIGAPVASPGKIREMRKTLARFHTIRKEQAVKQAAKE